MTDDQFTVDGIFQAKVTRKSDTIKGIYLTLEISGDDYSPALAQLRAGSLLKMGWQELIDVSVRPIEVENSLGGASPSPPFVTVPRPQANEAGTSKPKQRFAELPLSQQAALRCGDAQFRQYLTEECGIDLLPPFDQAAASYVRTRCRVKSRSELDVTGDARAKWMQLDASYRTWLTDKQYEGARR